MKSDEIYLAHFPFGGSVGRKLRPVLLLTGPLGSVPEMLVAYISSVIPSVALSTDITLDPGTAEHASTNLKTVSVVRLHKLAHPPQQHCSTTGPAFARHVGRRRR